MFRLAIYAFFAVAALSFAEQRGFIPVGKYLPQAPRLSASLLSSLTSTAGGIAVSAAHAATPVAQSFTARIAARGS